MKRILLLHTGGTLGMAGSPLRPDEFQGRLAGRVPELSELAEIESQIICNLDSSDIGPPHWTALATAIEDQRDDFQGFVIIHGTDTMAYTASALAFALQGLDCPVVMTGAQRPLAALRSDAPRNLSDAVEMATCDIPEVGICFDGMLLRGCRSTKSDAISYRAFNSPGCDPLARLGVNIQFGEHVRRPSMPFRCDPRFDAHVLAIHVTPGMRPSVLEAAATADARLSGIVLMAFGLGTAPNAMNPLAPVIRELVDSGIEVMVATQAGGVVDMGAYANGVVLHDAGAIGGGRMLLEAAITKMMHAVAAYPDRNARRRYLEWNVAGELG